MEARRVRPGMMSWVEMLCQVTFCLLKMSATPLDAMVEGVLEFTMWRCLLKREFKDAVEAAERCVSCMAKMLRFWSRTT